MKDKKIEVSTLLLQVKLQRENSFVIYFHEKETLSAHIIAIKTISIS